jgi:protein-S-isoprenylcysteine O-methyltransferase
MFFSLYDPPSLVTIFFFSEALVHRYMRRDDYSANHDQGSKGWLILVTLVSLALARLAKLTFPEAHSTLLAQLATVGVGLFFVGICLRWVCIIHLGRFFTTEVSIVSEHKLVETGPYRLVRHPSYSGLLLALFGIGICSGNALTLAVLILPNTVSFLYRIRIEEAVLAKAFGSQYDVYCAKTKRLVPFVY